jgi:hypothetical protein
MVPHWLIPDGAITGQAQAQLEASAGEVWKVVAGVLGAVVAILAGIIWKDVQEDKREAKDREARLNDLLAKRSGGDRS